MPPPKKAAQKAAKKAAKKAALKHVPHRSDTKHHEGDKERKNLGRAFEHMGRIDVLERMQPAHKRNSVHALATLAKEELLAGRTRQAAELLRGAEHFTFANIASEFAEVAQVGDELAQAIQLQYTELLQRAADHWAEGLPDSGVLAEIYKVAMKRAASAFRNQNYFQALEFVRAAEALAHVKPHAPLKLKPGQEISSFALEIAG